MKAHKLKINGQEVTEKEFHKNGPVGGSGIPMVTTTYSEAKPLISDALGCMKNQVPEMREAIRAHNIKGVRVLDNGQLEITSRQGRKEVGQMRPIPLHDGEGGYGDG